MSSAEPMQRAPSEVEPADLADWVAAALGVAVVRCEPIPAGVGRRRFYRLHLAGPPGSAIARVDAPEDPAGRPAGAAPEPPLEPVRAYLERHGLPVPRRLAADPARGLELLEDAGSESLADAFATAPRARAEALVARALDLVPRLQRLADDGSGVAAFARRLDATLFRYKAELFASTSLPHALGRAPSAAETSAVLDAFSWIARHCARAPQRFAHRDLQSQNLILRGDTLTLIDLQGAFLAPPEYDLVCLLRDSYLELDERFVAGQQERLRPLLPDAPARGELALRFDLLTLTRKGKDHARFLTAIARGDRRYRRFVPRTAAMLRRAAERTQREAPPLARLAELVLALPEEPPMRAMIVAAGIGRRLQPLTLLRPKPAVPVRGIPLVAYPLALLAHAGVREVTVNVHHLPERLIEAGEAWCPPGVALCFSEEPVLLDTGGGIARVAAFLRESDPCLLIGGDMVVDLDLPALIAQHRASGRAVTAVLRRDPRADEFGTIGVDRTGRMRRIGRRFDLGGEVDSGVYTWVNVVSPRAFDWLPEREVFSHLDDWWAPELARGSDAIGAVVLPLETCRWEPVGTPAEYLHANFALPPLSYLDVDARARAAGVRIQPDLIVGAGAEVAKGARLERVVVWDGERVPAGCTGRMGVFAGGRFHPCEANRLEGAA